MRSIKTGRIDGIDWEGSGERDGNGCLGQRVSQLVTGEGGVAGDPLEADLDALSEELEDGRPSTEERRWKKEGWWTGEGGEAGTGVGEE